MSDEVIQRIEKLGPVSRHHLLVFYTAEESDVVIENIIATVEALKSTWGEDCPTVVFAAPGTEVALLDESEMLVAGWVRQ